MAKPVIVLFLHYAAIGFIVWISKMLLPSAMFDWYNCTACTLLWLIIANCTQTVSRKRFLNTRVTASNKAVLITGCDSGFGHHLAKRLNAKGFTVFASCLFPSSDGAKDLKDSCSDRLHVLGLDVTKDESVEKALEYVKEHLGTSEFWAVVNNAGVYKGFDVAWTPLQDFKDNLEVNTLGVVRVTKAFLPLLRSSKGRVVTVTSIAGRISCPNISAYSMSKFAAVCFCDSLRQEMQPWGVKVISIEPELFKTQMTSGDNLMPQLDAAWNSATEETKSDYGENYINSFKDQIIYNTNFSTAKIYRVIDSLYDAVSLEEPSPVYKPSRNLGYRILVWLIENCPKPELDFVGRLYKYLIRFPVPKEAENTL